MSTDSTVVERSRDDEQVPEAPLPEGQKWRGVAADGRDDLTDETTAKLAGRSRRLLRDLLRPYRRVV
jgi:hypothetical protein